MKARILLPVSLGLVLSVGACTRSADTRINSASAAGNQEVQLMAEGLTTGSRGLHHSNIINFGAPRAQVEAAIRGAIGAPTAGGRNADCPTGTVDYVTFGALNLNFENGRFVGWVVDGAGNPELETYHGLSVGDRRSELDGDAEITVDENSTLGTELVVDGVGALLDGAGPNGRVTTLFSGVTCFAR